MSTLPAARAPPPGPTSSSWKPGEGYEVQSVFIVRSRPKNTRAQTRSSKEVRGPRRGRASRWCRRGLFGAIWCGRGLLERCVECRRVHPCCAQSRHPLSLRPACSAGSTGRPAAAGAALPHAHPVVFAQGHAREALHQLAAGSRRLTTSRASSSRTRPTSSASRWTWSPRWRCSIPFDFFLEPYAETFPFGYEGAEKRDLAPYLVMFRGEPLFSEYLAAIPRERKRTIDFLVELNRSSSRDIKYLIRMEPGVQTPELTLTQAPPVRAATPPGCWCRCCGTWAWRRVSSPGISSSSPPT